MLKAARNNKLIVSLKADRNNNYYAESITLNA